MSDGWSLIYSIVVFYDYFFIAIKLSGLVTCHSQVYQGYLYLVAYQINTP